MTYIIESIEYVPSIVLPPCTLWDDPDEVAGLLDLTRRSILESDG